MSSVFADHRPFNSNPPLLLVVCRFLFDFLPCSSAWASLVTRRLPKHNKDRQGQDQRDATLAPITAPYEKRALSYWKTRLNRIRSP